MMRQAFGQVVFAQQSIQRFDQCAVWPLDRRGLSVLLPALVPPSQVFEQLPGLTVARFRLAPVAVFGQAALFDIAQDLFQDEAEAV